MIDNRINLGLFVIGTIIASLAIWQYFEKPVDSSLLAKTSLAERDAAITEAKKEGKKEYSYTTHFIPGIGYITDPQAYLKQQSLNK